MTGIRVDRDGAVGVITLDRRERFNAMDVAMAQAAGVADVFARYGDVRGRPGYDLLRRVSHWTPAMLAGAECLAEADVRPTHVLKSGFAELLDLIEPRRFVPRRGDGQSE